MPIVSDLYAGLVYLVILVLMDLDSFLLSAEYAIDKTLLGSCA